MIDPLRRRTARHGPAGRCLPDRRRAQLPAVRAHVPAPGRHATEAVRAHLAILLLLFARGIVRPIRRLIDATEALKRGDYDAAQVRVNAGDEIGALGRTVNVMIDVLRQRQRERSLREPGRR
jgi:HAMP domain-containing protein